MTSKYAPSRRAAALAILALTVALFATHLHAAAVRLTREEEAALASVNTISRAFTGVAKIIQPAVVNIQVERRVSAMNNRYNDPREFFNEIFPGFPGMPGFPPGFQPGRPQVETEISSGSGVIVDNRGYILTNNHVIGEADAIRVSLLDGREFPAELIGADPGSDVAVIKVNADNLTVAAIGDSDVIEVGEWVLAVGNPFGLNFTVTSGIISARGRSGMNMLAMEDFIQTDASINPGNSGGPLVNLKGEVIGINTFIISPSAGRSGSVGVGFAIPSNMAKSIMQSLIAHKQVTSSYLGVETDQLTQDNVEAYGLQAPKGALVKSVNKGSPAERAGLRRGDVVVRWGKRDIASDLQLRNLVVITSPGEPVDVEVIRGGRTVLLRVVLDATAPEVVVKGSSDGIPFLQAMGLEVADLSPELRREFGYDKEAFGVLVTRAGIDASRIGLQQGSLIFSINGIEIRDMQELRTVLGSAEQSKNYMLAWRNGERVTGVTLTLN